MTFKYPSGPDDESVDSFTRGRFARAHEFYGSKDVDGLMYGGQGERAPTPWPQAGHRRDRQDYDRNLVREAITGPQQLEDVDPRHLHATQSSITRGGVDYYMGDEYRKTGRTYADQGSAGNRFPVVYAREDGQNLLLSGHHRASAALLQGEQFQARRVEGPWGPKRER